MAIKDLAPKQPIQELVAQVTGKEDAREFEKFGRSGKVCNAKLKDATGEVKVTFWNEQVDQIKDGDTIKITGGWVGEWQGEMQVSTGRGGKLEVIEGGADVSVSDAPAEAVEPVTEPQPAATPEPAAETPAEPEKKPADMDVTEEEVI